MPFKTGKPERSLDVWLQGIVAWAVSSTLRPNFSSRSGAFLDQA
jgi:hypothetical protein